MAGQLQVDVQVEIAIERRLIRYWSDDKANYLYSLQSRQSNWGSWNVVLANNGNYCADKDASWATAIAIHYKIPLPQ